MKKLIRSLPIFILLTGLSFPTYGAKRALLVGINDYKNLPKKIAGRGVSSDLRGSVNDVKIMKEVLTSQYGFSPDEIRVLTDKDATRNNIKQVFKKWLISGSKGGDLVLFFFSGHGSLIPDYSRDEKDGKDEVLCPYDFKIRGGRNVILDDELGNWLRELQGREVVVIIDSCHSGTMTRSIKKEVVSFLEDTPSARSKLVPIIDYKPEDKKTRSIFSKKDEPEGQIFMSAAKDHSDRRRIRDAFVI